MKEVNFLTKNHSILGKCATWCHMYSHLPNNSKPEVFINLLNFSLMLFRRRVHSQFEQSHLLLVTISMRTMSSAHSSTCHREVCRREQIFPDVEVLSVYLPPSINQMCENFPDAQLDHSAAWIIPLWTQTHIIIKFKMGQLYFWYGKKEDSFLGLVSIFANAIEKSNLCILWMVNMSRTANFKTTALLYVTVWCKPSSPSQ